MNHDEGLTPTVTLARLYEKQGFLDKAVSVYKKLLSVEPGRADIKEALESVEKRLASSGNRSSRAGSGNLAGSGLQGQGVIQERNDMLVLRELKAGKILVIHGPNLNMLGRREPSVYGSATLEEINQEIERVAADCGMTVETFQSNHEGEIVEKIHEALDGYDALIINPAAYTHTSVAIRDALLILNIPIIEVHLSNVHGRESFRRESLIADVVTGQIVGFGKDGYTLAVTAVSKMTRKSSPTKDRP